MYTFLHVLQPLHFNKRYISKQFHLFSASYWNTNLENPRRSSRSVQTAPKARFSSNFPFSQGMLIFQLLAVATSIEEMRFGMNEMLMSTPFNVFQCASIGIRFVFFRNIFEEELEKGAKMLKSIFLFKARYDLVNKHV